jgi:phosphinothricin acetyltransferase
VVEDTQNQVVAGYACYDQFRSIQGFQQTVEHSIFLNPDYAGQGLGSKLLQYLIEQAQVQKLHIMVAAIDSENNSSIRLHEKLGFVQTAYMPQVGQKFGQWRDLVLLQLNLDQA